MSGRPIVFFLSGDFPEGNGANSRIKAYAHALQDAGNFVELIYLWPSLFNNEGINSRASGTWENIPFRFITGDCRRPETFTGKLFQSIQSFLLIINYFIINHRKFQISYLYSPEIIFHWHVILLSKIFRKKIIFEQTELKSSFRDIKRPPHKFLRFLNQWDERNAHHLCDHMIVISKNLFTHYKDYFAKDRLSLIPIVVDLRRFNNSVVQQKNLIGYIGSFGYKDGIEGMINAFERAYRQNPEIRLRMIGYCENFDRIKNIIDSKNLTSCVELTGLVRYNMIPILLEECELLLMNRIDTKYAHYGSPTKLAEYLASGVPTVVTNVGDIKDYLTHQFDTYIITAENEIELSNTILLRFREKELFNAMGKQGRITCEQKFSHSTQLKQLVKIMESI